MLEFALVRITWTFEDCKIEYPQHCFQSLDTSSPFSDTFHQLLIDMLQFSTSTRDNDEL